LSFSLIMLFMMILIKYLSNVCYLYELKYEFLTNIIVIALISSYIIFHQYLI
jgi:hypothetical protein